ncbi:MAG: HD domain-containing protein [Thermoproteota archaeon]
MDNERLIEKIKAEALKHYCSDNSGHDWLHAERVYRMCMRIMKEEGGDAEVLTAAALLHDVGYRYELEEYLDHSEKSVEIAREVLGKIGFPGEKIERVLEAIRSHRFSKGLKAESLESKILQDADRLDSIGAIGIARAFSYGAARVIPMYMEDLKEDSTLRHFYEKLLKVKDSLNTETARRIAVERHMFMELFISRLLAEINGKK